MTPAGRFGRWARLGGEIGSGAAASCAALAAARPSYDVLAFEVWRPGVASSLTRLEAAGATNVRLIQVDSVWSMKHLFVSGSIVELWTLFPDPWPKKRHHKRRLLQASFVHALAERLAPGGYLHVATDWTPYADEMLQVLDAEPLLRNTANGLAERPAWRPQTKFETRGLRLGHEVRDLVFEASG